MKKTTTASVWIIVATLIAYSQEKGAPEALLKMADTERAFAKLSVEKGVREAFTTFFADDGVNFQPHPVNRRFSIWPNPPKLRKHGVNS